MKIHNNQIPIFLLLLLLGSACGDLGSGTLNFGGSDDDDDTSGDDDDTSGDDDDDTSGDDDDASGDDDDASGDDDTSGGDDDDTPPGSDHELSGDYEGEVWMMIDAPSGGGGGGGDDEEPTCRGEAGLEVEADGRFSTEAECRINWLNLTYSFELEGTVSSSNQFVGEVSERNSWTEDVSHYETFGWLKEGKIFLEWDGATPGVGRASRPYTGLFWFSL